MTQQEQHDLMNDVRKFGYEINTIDELIRIDDSNRDLIPLLLSYISVFSDDDDKEFIVRCLGVKGFYEVESPLLSEFYQTDNNSYKWAIANTLYIIAGKEHLSEFLEIVQDKRHASSRQMIVYGLGRYKTPEVKQVLLSLLEDDDVNGHAIYALGNLRDTDCIPYIEPFLTNEKAWKRNNAKAALKKIEKAAAKNKF